MQNETSAGGVIVAEKNHELHVLLLKDKNGKWTFPKGLIEIGEKREVTATREISEEVGLKNLKLIAPLAPATYLYRWEGKLKKKTVHYYLFKGKGTELPTPQTEEGILQVRWIPFSEAEKIIGYPQTNKKLLRETMELLLTRHVIPPPRL
ncbi:TPA: hypothetical protein DIV55_00575 [Patescibacteria group bacterium]|uniref:NUDIX hydrolase n=1 Tax=Candidatus Gottesmanbacteria bacterium GW2011_GWA1_43_11 TaxID=1618436 RepID=A0A0G1EKL1_9BACT|nr:MAG: NUDIX hydrolase [Candidatus Gottesmanbacteria bacterium GW2011_GWA1_43_11]HCS78218.1 hypothetical protein [Patescibacteria group bacterium]